jgi:ATP-dependent helicase/nuclease subunit B
MSISRTFLDWSRPALPAVASYLIDRYAQAERLDLGNVLLVLPGRRAGRRLLELLVEKTETTHPDFVPPQILTASSLPERLYEPIRTFATRSVERLAWYEALRKVDRHALRAYVPHPPADEDFSGWMALADQLLELHRNLLADQFDFGSVIPAGRGLTGFDKSEERRWQILDEIQRQYLLILDRQLVWDLQTARKVAVEKCECETDHDVILVGSVDLNRTLRSILDQVAEKVTPLIYAPGEQANLFDEYGCLVTDEWLDYSIDLVDRQVHIVERHTNQARQVVECLAGYDARFSADEITIGITDEALVPYLQRHLAASDVAARWVVEKNVRETSPFRLLNSIGEFLECNGHRTHESSWWQASQFASLIRHPDLERWIHALPCFGSGELQRNWLTQLDSYMAEHLQPMLGFWLGPSKRSDSLQTVFDQIQELLAPLQVRNARKNLVSQPLTDWSDAIRVVLLAVYGEQQLDSHHPTERLVIHAMEAIFAALAEQSHIPKELVPLVTSSQAIQLTLAAVSQEPIPPLPDDQAVEMLGWLELSLDDAPALVITNFNDGFVPESVTSDTFLPNNLRQRMGLNHNDHRYARDAYALTTMLKSREDVQLIIGRRDSRDDPLKPSRLLFATDPESIATRVLSFLEPHSSPRPAETGVTDGQPDSGTQIPTTTVQKTLAFDADDEIQAEPKHDIQEPISDRQMQPTKDPSGRIFDPAHDVNPFIIPPPEKGEPLKSIGVTSFKTYLQSPYRFYLKHVKRLKSSDDGLREMDPLRFGNLMHEVLERFGHSSVRDSTSTKDIRSQLMSALDAVVERCLGRYRTAAVNVQIEQMRQRLSRFAAWQSEWAAQGWKIFYAEQKDQQFTVPLELAKNQSILITGRIDRIDQNSRTGEFAILDYKTGDTVEPPNKTHQKNGDWIDLQLPLYRLLAEPLGVTGHPKLAYVALPANLDKVGEKMATWTDNDIENALDVARHIALRILKQDFKAICNENVNTTYDDFARICQTTVRTQA